MADQTIVWVYHNLSAIEQLHSTHNRWCIRVCVVVV